MINWKLRLKNKTTLLSLAATIVAFVYQICSIFGYAPPIAEDQITQLVGIVVNILVAIGVVVDPTTKGISDSARAKMYNEPK